MISEGARTNEIERRQSIAEVFETANHCLYTSQIEMTDDLK